MIEQMLEAGFEVRCYKKNDRFHVDVLRPKPGSPFGDMLTSTNGRFHYMAMSKAYRNLRDEGLLKLQG